MSKVEHRDGHGVHDERSHSNSLNQQVIRTPTTVRGRQKEEEEICHYGEVKICPSFHLQMFLLSGLAVKKFSTNFTKPIVQLLVRETSQVTCNFVRFYCYFYPESSIMFLPVYYRQLTSFWNQPHSRWLTQLTDRSKHGGGYNSVSFTLL